MYIHTFYTYYTPTFEFKTAFKKKILCPTNISQPPITSVSNVSELNHGMKKPHNIPHICD